MHIILAVTDQGTPPLTRYQRVIVTVNPAVAAGPAAPVRWGTAVLRQAPEWYASAAARALADSVLQYQSPVAAGPRTRTWPPPVRPHRRGGGRRSQRQHHRQQRHDDADAVPRVVAHATGDARYRASFVRGFDYLLAAEYPNGGWPQFFPLRDGYYSRITFNDNAMVGVLTVLRDVAAGKPPYAFVDEARRAKARAAVSRGIDIILRRR